MGMRCLRVDRFPGCLAAWAVITCSSSHAIAQPQSTAMSYQGVLQAGGSPYNGTADFEFRLFDAASGGSQVGLLQNIPGQTIADGLMSATLNFDNPPPAASVFNGQERWLQISLRTPAGSANPFVTLSPRQKIAAAPYAAFALNAALPSTYGQAVNFSNAGNAFAGAHSGNGSALTNLSAANLTGSIASAQIAGTYGNVVSLSNASNTLNGTHSGNGAALTALNAANIASGNLAIARMPTGGTWPLTSPLTLSSQRVNVTAVNDVTDLTGGALVIGFDSEGLKLDRNTLQAVTVIPFVGTVVPTAIELNPAGGTVSIGSLPFGLNGELRVGGNGIATTRIDVGDLDDNGILRVNGSTLAATAGADGNVGVGTSVPVAKLEVREIDESATLTDFTQNVTDAGVLVTTNFLNSTYTPGFFWSSTNNNATKPKAGIFLRQFSAGTRMHFGTSNDFATGITNTAMVINEAGAVGIGTDTRSIDAALHVEATNARVVKVDRWGSDGELLSFARDDSSIASITVSAGTVFYGAFTGVHYAQIEDDAGVGSLVSLTGANTTLASRADGETVYGVKTTARANDPAVLGVYIGGLHGADYGHAHDLAQIAALGNGDVWVIDTGSPIMPGDYLIASDVPGCAMKDDAARFPIGHIIARAAAKVDWADVVTDSNGIRRARISVLFGNFVRDAAPRTDRDLAERVRRLEELLSQR